MDLMESEDILRRVESPSHMMNAPVVGLFLVIVDLWVLQPSMSSSYVPSCYRPDSECIQPLIFKEVAWREQKHP